jgi:filamentous hemagglutinin
MPPTKVNFARESAAPGSRTTRQVSAFALGGAASGWTLFAAVAMAAPPPVKLPTPCSASNCGTSAQSFVQYGSASASFNGTTVNIAQSTNKAILNWANFNIANGYTVNFIQPSATAAVLNNIWSADPSVIAGHLNAKGQVYLVNQNGIVFDKGAQINVAGLTASTLTLPNTTFENGILAANAPGQPPGPVFVAPPSGTVGAVDVNAGATLTASDGGRIVLLGSAVTNQGSISTPDGQTILGAATNNVYLAASTNSALRGLLIEVDGGGTTGTVINQGQINAARGNITLAGLIVNQEGLLSATTSVGANGSIYLVAGDASPKSLFYTANPSDAAGHPTAFGGLMPSNGGTLLLAPGSVTEVLPDPTDTGTLTVPQLVGFIPSQVDLAGKVVALEGNASIHAPGGTVNVYASADPYNLISKPSVPIADGGSFYMDTGSTIDVSGLSKVPVPVTQNLVQVTLETDDLQDDPLLRNGFLHGTTVTVDIRSPPTLFNVTPYADNIGSNIDQILTQAGQINLDATGTLITRAGSTLNVSGGSIAYQGGEGPSTTNLLATNGQVFNISSAPNNIQYVGIANSYSYTDPTWGTTTKVSGESYYPGYVQGNAAGTVTAESPEVYLHGALVAQTVDGIYQRAPASLAAGGTLVVGCSQCTNTSGTFVNYGVNGGVTFANNIPDDLVGNVILDGYVVSSVSLPAVTTLSPAQLAQNGFDAIDVYSNGAVTLPAGTNIAFAANGAVGIKSAQSIAIDGNIDAPGGSVSLQTVSTGDLLPHNINVAPGAMIDVSGTWTNDTPSVTPQPGTAPIVINGGSVSASAAGDVLLGRGSLINVSGGGWLNEGDKLTEGSAGSISLAASFTLGASTLAADPYTGLIDFGAGATLIGASLKAGQGGTLSLQSGSVTVGSTLANTPGELLLAPDFFVQGGFAHYDITGQNDVLIGNPRDVNDSAPVTIAPLQQTLVFTGNLLLQPTGVPLSNFTQLETLPLSLRSPASVSFIATASDKLGADIGNVTLAQDASIVTDPGASVLLAANGYNGNVRVFGTILAPAGNITLQLENPQNALQSGVDPGFIAGQVIELGPQAVLAAPAYAELNTLNPLGYVEGSVLPGGTVSLLANKGFVQTDYGSLVNVSGTAATLNVVGSNGVTPATVGATAGTINIGAREGIVLQGNLLAQPGSLNGAVVGGAPGGTLSVDLGYGYNDSGPTSTSAQNLTGTGGVYPTTTRVLTIAGVGPNGFPAVPPSNQLLSGTGVIDVSTIEAGGFANVAISSADTIAFAGTVALAAKASLTLDSPLFTSSPMAQVNLSAPYVAVGNLANNIFYYDVGAASPNAAAVLNPISGTATLDISAQLIDIRGISGWSGFATENFTSAGDIRFVASENAFTAPPSVNVSGNPAFEGALNTSGNLFLQGAQLYPTTATGFAINDLPPGGTAPTAPAPTLVNISSSLPTTSPTPATPLSAGGSLTINATNIDQFGVLRAPMGQIALNGVPILNVGGNIVVPGSVTLESGSLTSVSANGLTIPYGATVNGTQWTYTPAEGNSDILTQPPAKQISLNGTSVAVNGSAKLDLSGGGDLYAYEYIAGEGGSVDVLDPASLPAAAHPAGKTVYTYAIVPTLGSSFAPIDPQYDQGSTVTTGQTITLSGVPGLAAGTYALLPARYALLPGAYAIQVVQANSNVSPGSSVAQPGGAYEVAARFGVAGTNTLSSLTSTVLVASDTTVRTESQYTDSYANAFFSSAARASGTVAPSLPADAGQLLLSATNQLTLNGSINFKTGSFVSGTSASGTPITQQGPGGDVSITAQNIIVVDPTATQTQVPAGTVQLNVQQLDNLGAQTLIIGGSSTTTPAGEQINVGSTQTGFTQTVELENTTALTAPSIILAAQDSVIVDPNAKITTTGASSSSSQVPIPLLLPGGGALLRVSNGSAATITVDPATLPPTPTGIVTVGSAAEVEAAGSLLLYGTNTTTIATGAQISAPAVSLFSSQVSMGAVPADTPGLTLTSQLLGNLGGLRDLTIGSGSTIDFYGALQLGTPSSATPNLQNITLDAAGLGGYGAGDKVLQAGSITLTNSSGTSATFANAPDGRGSLQLIASGTSTENAGASSTSGAGQITLGAGSKTVSGFTGLNIQAAGDIVGQGSGSLTVASAAAVPVNLTSVALIGAAGSDQALTTTGAVTITGSTPNSKITLPVPGVGAEWAIQGSAIAQNGTIDLPAGILSLTASSGDVTLGKGSLTSAGGAVQGYTVANAVAAGGQITLAAQAGNVDIAAGATVDVSGASTTGTNAVAGAAGSLSVSAPLGTFAFAGSTLKGGAAAGQAQGGFVLDVGSGLSGAGFAALNTMLGSSGFTGAVDLRTRGDPSVSIANTIQATSFELTVDAGSIDVTGTGVINTSGGTALNTDGGAITLWAGTGLTVDAGAHLLANAGAAGPMGANGASLASTGGDITLGTATGNLSIAGGTPQHPTVISMQGGGAAATDGTLTLRAPRTADDTNVQIQVQGASSMDLVTRNPVVVEGFKVYSASDLGSTDAGCGSGGSCDVADLSGMIYADAATFTANSPTIAANLGFSNVQIRPGIEVDSAGDLILDNSTTTWDLASWNAALGASVNVTLRAAGNLIFEASLSDGFTNNGKGASSWTFGEPPGSATGSASYTLTGGADLSSANPLAVIAQPAPASSLAAAPNEGNVILTPGNVIRTGSGNISIAAGGDVLLGYSVGDANGNLYDGGTLQVKETDPLTSAIYTAGVPSVLTAAQAALFIPTTPPRSSGGTVLPAYPTDGGNISVSASDDVRSATSAELISDWLWRRGPTNGTVGPGENTSWWIMFNDFRQGIGVLGGGNLSLSAGRDIVNTSAVIPTTGRLLVAAGGTPVASDLLLTGGGNLRVQAGGNIVSGVFEDDWGNASIAAGGALTSSADSTFGQETAALNLNQITNATLPSPSTEIYPILAVGNGVFNVSARAGIALDGVVNSTTLPLTLANTAENQNALPSSGNAAFFTYAPNAHPSTLNLVSAGGDITLNEDSPTDNLPIAVLSSAAVTYEFTKNLSDLLSTYPSTVNVASLSGNINLGDATLAQTNPNGVAITLFPAAAGNLRLLAAGSITNDGQPYQITMSQSDPAQAPSPLAPSVDASFAGVSGVPLPQQLLHQGDAQPIAMVADTGGIGSGDLVFPKAANIIAGGSITDLNYVGSNLNPSDVTLSAAGGDINFSTNIDPATNALLSNSLGIELAGPGNLEVLAGGSVNLGNSNGILTTGSLSDTRLQAVGASMIVGAGLGTNAAGGLRQPAYQSFINTYLTPNSKTAAPSAYAATLVSYMQQINPAATTNSNYSAALSNFEALTPAQQLPLLAQVLSDELSATGLAHTLQGASYTRGYTAINTLFPTTDSSGNTLAYDGNLNLALSQLKTEQGGDIDLLVPGGSVVVGYANPPATLTASKEQTVPNTNLFVPPEVNLGILVLGQGAVQGFADQDFTVNQSRILTLEGGDIILWASNGNIDAGKGAKSASGAPPPVIETDASGNLFVDPSNAVTGSGIGQLLTTPGLKAGLVNLIAPKGDVNAGDAGIRVAGNLNIAAVQVIGAGNITVVGTATGVPVSEAGAFAGALSGANSLGDAGKSAVDQLSQNLGNAANYQEMTQSLQPTFIVVKMFCLGVECETN